MWRNGVAEMSKPKKPRRNGRAVTVAKGGRPRLPDVVREPNGRPSRRVIHVGERREMNERKAKAVGIAARVKHTGLPEHLAGLNHAGMPNAGSVHGVMRLLGEQAERRAEQTRRPCVLGPGMLSAGQWSAAEWYLGTYTAYLRAIDAPGRKTTERGDGLAMLDAKEQAAWARETIALWKSIMTCLQAAASAGKRPVVAAFDVILLRNLPMPHLEADLRLGLDALLVTFPFIRPVGG